MSRFDDCIRRKVDKGEVSEKKAKDLLDRLEDYNQVYEKQGYSGAEAEKMAEDRVVNELNFEKASKKLMELNKIETRQNILANLKKNAGKDGTYGDAALHLIDLVENRKAAYQGIINAPATKIAVKYRNTVWNSLKNWALGEKEQYDILRELHGKDTGNQNAKVFAELWRKTDEQAVNLFNSKGGFLNKLEDFGIPRMWDEVTLSGKGREWFRDFVMKNNDWDRTEKTLGYTLDDAARAKFADETFNSITSDGLNDIKPGSMGSASYAMRRSDPRKIFFKDPETEIQLHEQGITKGNFIEAMMHHTDAMAHDIAMMDVFGANPASNARWTQGVILKQAGDVNVEQGATNVEKTIKGQKRKAVAFEDAFAIVNGSSIMAPPNKLATYAMKIPRQTLAAVQLGKAVVSAFFGDNFVTAPMAAQFAGASYTRYLGEYFKTVGKMVSGGNPEEMSRLMRSGVVVRSYINTTLTQQRYLGEAFSSRGANIIVDKGMRMALLAPHTMAAQAAVAKTIMGDMAEDVGKAFKDLPMERQRTLTRYEISPEEWDKIRSTKLGVEDDDTKWLTPQSVFEEHGDELGKKLGTLINGETRYFVTESGARARASLMPNKKGTMWGEFMASHTQYLGFTFEFVNNHFDRLKQMGVGYESAKYLMGLVGLGTLMGAADIQTRNLIAGKDLEPMNKPMFWARAFGRNPVTGLLGQYLINDGHSFGGWAGISAGPLLDFYDKTIGDLALRPLWAATDGKDYNYGKKLFDAMNSYNPVSNNILVGTAFQRMFMDELQRMLDPKASASFRDRIRQARQQGTDYWWAPGENMPQRTPDLSKALGGQ